MALVVAGLLNKQVSGQLGISEIAAKAHRGQVMEKMKANSFADLPKMAARLRVPAAPGAHGRAFGFAKSMSRAPRARPHPVLAYCDP